MKLIQSKEELTSTIIDGNSLINQNEIPGITYAESNQIIETLENIYQNTTKVNICMITGLNGILNKKSITEKTKLTELLDRVKTTNHVKVIVVDTIDNIKTLNYDTWFKNNVSLSEGIWIGNGIANQFTLKVTTSARILRAEIEPNFGYVIRRGKANLTKWVTED